MTFETWFKDLHNEIPFSSVVAVLKLVADGATVPFMARYRKEQTGNLDEVQIQKVIDANENWDAILKRQKHILEEIEKQGKLTAELKSKIESTFQLNLLEDLYLPFKQKRKTKATLAKEAGLELLANWIWECAHGERQPEPGQTLDIWAFTFRNEEKGFNTSEAAIQGAMDILVERLSEMQDLRQLVREKTFKDGYARTGKGPKVKPHSKYENYFDSSESIASLMKPENAHRYLAMRRGWIEEELTLSLGGKPDSEGGDSGFEKELLSAFENRACTKPDAEGAAIALKAARIAYKSHVQSSIDNEAHKALKEVADRISINVFAENVRKLLMASPFGPKAVLGVDPGVRTGCKLAIVDDSGKYIASTVMMLVTDAEKEVAHKMLPEVVKNANIRAVAVGNGTAGRETEVFVRKALKDAGLGTIPVVMVSESGASIYSASDVAREEFPDLDLTVRGAISIARRLQDPLAELVKVDPKSIGVGQYQHDVSESGLKRSLDHVVESCVNQVGVNLNTASYHLLAHVSGIGPTLAKNVVEYRGKNGIFRTRKALLEVPRFSEKVFEQAAGFLRVPESENPLDKTGVHPEKYPILEKVAEQMGKKIVDLMGDGAKILRANEEFKKEVGEFTFKDILTELEKPGRDPREEFVPFQYREDIHELKDLQVGMICPGIVTNVTNFGAFVDIGVHQDGLVHLSELAHKFVKDPKEVVSPGDRVSIKVLSVNLEKSQISLSIKQATAPTQADASQSRGRRDSASREQRPRDREMRAKVDQHQAKPKVGQPPQKFSKPQFNKNPEPAPKITPKKPAPAFNNAFAGLAGLRDQLKKK